MPGAKRRVLLADDDPGLRRLIGTTLGTDDFDLLQAVDGEEALRMARQQHPELVLLDVNMSKRSGFEVLTEIRKVEMLGQCAFRSGGLRYQRVNPHLWRRFL